MEAHPSLTQVKSKDYGLWPLPHTLGKEEYQLEAFFHSTHMIILKYGRFSLNGPMQINEVDEVMWHEEWGRRAYPWHHLECISGSHFSRLPYGYGYWVAHKSIRADMAVVGWIADAAPAIPKE